MPRLRLSATGLILLVCDLVASAEAEAAGKSGAFPQEIRSDGSMEGVSPRTEGVVFAAEDWEVDDSDSAASEDSAAPPSPDQTDATAERSLLQMKMSASGKNKKQDKKQAGTRHDHESSSSKSKSSSSTSSASTGRSGGSSAATATATTEKKHHRSSHKEKEKVVEKNHYGPGFSFGVGYNQGYYPPPGPCGGCCMYGGGQAIFWILGMAAGLVGCVLLVWCLWRDYDEERDVRDMVRRSQRRRYRDSY